MIQALLFYLFAFITVISSIFVVTLNNLVRSAFSLLFTLLGVASLYILLGADFIGGIQVLIYVGGILVLILFGVMLTQKAFRVRLFAPRTQVLASLFFSLLTFIAIVYVIWTTPWKVSTELEPPIPTTHTIGVELLNTYILPFEVVSIVLLLVLVGAVFIVRREVSDRSYKRGSR